MTDKKYGKDFAEQRSDQQSQGLSTVLEIYARVAADFTTRLENCASDKWDDPSPCPGWTAWDVAAHVVRNHRRAVAGLTGVEFAAVDRSEDLMATWYTARDAVTAALANSLTAHQMLGDEFGNMSFDQFVRRMACSDTLIHTWDFARATGQDEHLDAEAVRIALGFLIPEDKDIRIPGAYGNKIVPGPDADEQTWLLNFLGREV